MQEILTRNMRFFLHFTGDPYIGYVINIGHFRMLLIDVSKK
ncbi:hypothetical protein [Candidatus Tisiphia endosymbiont of Empis tessellata]|jgi:hypothetical protein